MSTTQDVKEFSRYVSFVYGQEQSNAHSALLNDRLRDIINQLDPFAVPPRNHIPVKEAEGEIGTLSRHEAATQKQTENVAELATMINVLVQLLG